jgi:ubiquitin fusion degradation protein 1
MCFIHLISSHSKARVVTNESIANDGRMVPAALDLPPGKLFFGFTYKPYDPNASTVKKVEPEDGAGVCVFRYVQLSL